MTNREKAEIKLSGYAMVEKMVKAGTNTSGRVYVPKSWIGRRVTVVLLDEPGDDVVDDRMRRMVYGEEDDGFRRMI
ncbi:DUF2080 family transposase-associated protein [Methanorbis furvi]|uniref:DUF2080 family transposase-associated protein n=1 Tax=Methanorbis furvi TaxID=3028299 RepID=A0AAE4MEM7_9EURY|nr:hypothetical protein [Methanocorpusculaceae archaeon Ag1]